MAIQTENINTRQRHIQESSTTVWKKSTTRANKINCDVAWNEVGLRGKINVIVGLNRFENRRGLDTLEVFALLEEVNLFFDKGGPTLSYSQTRPQ